jgi:hypothetical protein
VIDRVARDQASAALRRFIGGKTTNDEFLCELPLTNRQGDRVLRVAFEFLDNFSDDLRTHYFKPAGVTREGIAALTRMLCFLDSDLPYEWPNARLHRIRPPAPSELFIFSWIRRWFARRDQAQDRVLGTYGDLNWWPFRNEEQYHATCDKPGQAPVSPSGWVVAEED